MTELTQTEPLVEFFNFSPETAKKELPQYFLDFLEKKGEKLQQAFQVKGFLKDLAIWETLGEVRDFFPSKKEDFREMFGVFVFDEETQKIKFFGQQGEFDKVDVSYFIQMAPSMYLDLNGKKRFIFFHTHPESNKMGSPVFNFPEQFSTADKDRFDDLIKKFIRKHNPWQTEELSLP